MRLMATITVLTVIILLSVSYASHWLVVDDTLDKTDLCMPMSGYQYRIRETVDLYNAGSCEFVFLAKGGSKPVPADSLYIPRNLVKLGVPESSFVIDDSQIHSSYEEIHLFLSYLVRNGLANSTVESGNQPSVTIVTDPFHTRRVSMVSGWVLETQVNVRVHATVDRGIKPTWFWLQNARARRHVTREYIKIAYYIMRGLNYVNNLRALAILLIVFGHSLIVIQTENDTIEKLLGLLGSGTVYFVVLAGFLFARINLELDYFRYLHNKIFSIVLPYLVISVPGVLILILGLKSSHHWIDLTWFHGELNLIEQLGLLLSTGAHVGSLWFVPMILLLFLAAPLFHQLSHPG